MVNNMLTDDEISQCINLRKALHQQAELSNQEVATAKNIVLFMANLQPDDLITHIAGTGIAVCFGKKNSGKTVLFRCELDALPIAETLILPHGSCQSGVSHKCGHDGHMAILAGVAQFFSRNRPGVGRVILLFQPAEETGEGANNILNDVKFTDLQPDYVFALHNVPGYPLAKVLIKPDTFCGTNQTG